MEEPTTPPNNPAPNMSDTEFFGAPPKEYAGFWIRFVALIIDTLLVNVAITPVAMLIGMPSPFDMDPGEMGVEFTFVKVGGNWLTIMAQWAYYAAMESSAKQATVGKMALGLIVTDEDGNRLTFGRATGRYFGKLLSALILFVGYFMAGFTAKKQALHDILAKTLVIKKPVDFKG